MQHATIVKMPADAAAHPSPAELLERARAMQGKLRERGDAAEAARNVPEETIAEMQAAGFFRILQPKRFGPAAHGYTDFSRERGLQ